MAILGEGVDFAGPTIAMLFDDLASLDEPSLSEEEALLRATRTLCRHLGHPVGHAWTMAPDGETLHSSGQWHVTEGLDASPLVALVADSPERTASALGDRLPADGPVVRDLATAAPDDLLAQEALRIGFPQSVVLPVWDGTDLRAVIEVFGPTSALQPDTVDAVAFVASRVAAVLREARTSAAVIEREKLLAALFEVSADVVGIVDLEGRFLQVSQSAVEVLGYLPEELVGMVGSDLLIQPDDADQDPEAAKGGLSRSRFRRKDGGVAIIESHWAPVMDDDGAIKYVISIGRDVREQVALEEDLQRARLAAEAGNVAKSLFLSRMSHELRTPMNAVLGFAQLLEMDLRDGADLDSVQRILDAGRHLLSLINDVLDISRVDASEMPVNLASVPVADVMHEAAAMLAPAAMARQMAVVVEADRDVVVLADDHRLRQVLVNLLSNAIKYGRPRGLVELRASQVDGRIRIDVADDGDGIDPAHALRVFEPFDRLGRDDQTPGVGLGLPLARSFTELMGGELTLGSEAAGGAVFTIDLAAGVPADVVQKPRPQPERANPRSVAQVKVVYVEDNVPNLRLVEAIMQRRFPDVELLSTTQGSLALELIEAHKPHLVLLDLHLPDVSGVEILRGLRASAFGTATEVIIVTADATEEARDGVSPFGVRHVLTKPFDAREFVRTVDEALQDAVQARGALH